jgi:hypothetical protein
MLYFHSLAANEVIIGLVPDIKNTLQPPVAAATSHVTDSFSRHVTIAGRFFRLKLSTPYYLPSNHK